MAGRSISEVEKELEKIEQEVLQLENQKRKLKAELQSACGRAGWADESTPNTHYIDRDGITTLASNLTSIERRELNCIANLFSDAAKGRREGDIDTLRRRMQRQADRLGVFRGDSFSDEYWQINWRQVRKEFEVSPTFQPVPIAPLFNSFEAASKALATNREELNRLFKLG